MKVERFEDLICWQKARVMTNEIYALSRENNFSRDFDLVRQSRRAATSTMSNIAEGFESWTRKEFVRFLDIAKGSAGEVRSQLYVAVDQRYITAEQFESARTMVIEVSKTVAGLIDYLASSTTYKVREGGDDDQLDIDLPSDFVNLGTY